MANTKFSGKMGNRTKEGGGGKIKSEPAGIVGNKRNYEGEGSKGPWSASGDSSKNVGVKTANKQAGNLH